MSRGQWTTDLFDKLDQKTSRDAYKSMGTDLVTFLVGACLDKLGKVHVRATDEQRALAVRFVQALEDCDDSEEPYLQDFLLSIFTQSMKDETPHVFPVYRFLVFRSFRRDGSVEPCNNITQFISKIVFYGRACIFKRIMAIMKAEHRGFFS